MKQDVICKTCGQPVGRVHDYQRAETLRNHIKVSHPVLYNRLREIYQDVERLHDESKDVGVYGRDLFYYNKAIV